MAPIKSTYLPCFTQLGTKAETDRRPHTRELASEMYLSFKISVVAEESYLFCFAPFLPSLPFLLHFPSLAFFPALVVLFMPFLLLQ